MIEGLNKLGAVHMTLSERVYQELRQAVIAQRLTPGSQLRSQDLAQALRVSRTPVKEALFRLRQEGLVSYTERQGFFVTTITTEGLPGLFDARMMCEMYAIRKAIAEASDQELQPIADAMAVCRGFVEAEQEMLSGWYDADQALHRTIVSMAKNQRVLNWFMHLRTLTRHARIIGGAKRSSLDYDQAVREHQAIADGIIGRNLSAAEAALRHHYQGSLVRLMGYLSTPISSSETK